MKVKASIGALVLAAGAAVCFAEGGPGVKHLDEPVLSTFTVPHGFFGDATSIELFAALASEDDPLVREHVVEGLGQTHNPAAIQYIRKAAGDASATVRATAAAACAEFDAAATGKIVLTLLDDADQRVVLAAVAAARGMRQKSAVTKLQGLLQSRREASIRSLALRTLTELGMVVDAAALKPLLAEEGTTAGLRLAAVNNVLISSNGAQFKAELMRLAREDTPAVRGAALAALGRFAFVDAQALAHAARTSSNSFVRRGALWAFRNAGKGERIKEFLSDKSPMVVLAATKAAGRLKRAECVERLYEILLAAPDMELHLAARDSLAQLGGDTILPLADKYLQTGAKTHYGFLEKIAAYRLSPTLSVTALPGEMGMSARNLAALCYLLGHFDSKRQLDLRLDMLAKLRIDSEVMLDLVPSLVAAGEARSVRPLVARLRYCKSQGLLWLQAKSRTPPPPPVEYDPRVTEAIIDALADLGAADALDLIALTAQVNHSGFRLQRATIAAARAFVKLAAASNRAEIDANIVAILGDRTYSHTARFVMCKTAAKLKVRAAVEPIERILNEDRYCRLTIHCAAWAIQQITGTAPAMPEPVLYQDLGWIIVQPR